MSIDPKTTTLRDLAEIAHERGTKGKVATAEGLVDHTEAAFVGRSGSGTQTRRQFADLTPEQMKSELSEGLPPIVRRTPRERYIALLLRLRAEAEKSMKLHGRVIWPESLKRELAATGWRAGNPDLEGQVEALARRMFEKASHQQQESDQHKSARDWHGHDNTSITVSNPAATSG